MTVYVPSPTIPVGPKPVGTTGTGLDSLVKTITDDPGLNAKVPASEIYEGARNADLMNKIIVEAIKETGIANDEKITAADVRDLNAYIKGHHQSAWATYHGDDEDGSETGFHFVQNDGATTQLFGKNAVNTVADGIYHLGFCIEGNQLLNEDGNANASVESVAKWLNSLLADDLEAGRLANADVDPYYDGTTGTGLDQLVKIITDDPGLNRKIATSEIREGASNADQMNRIIVEAIKETAVANDGDISTADVRDLNVYIQSHYGAQWATLHGDDEGDSETGFHFVQNDGATTLLFGKNAVNTVADGIYHLGFSIDGCRLLNEDGAANASVESVGKWLDELLRADMAELYNDELDPYAHATTGTGLDSLVEIVTNDPGLERKIATSEIHEGARNADAMNQIIVEAIKETGIANDDKITAADVRDLNTFIQENYEDAWAVWHGDDEDSGEETGFHLVQNDGATTKLFDLNAVNTVADGIYHLGFDICGNRFLNEDGNANASVESVAKWLNSLLETDLAGDGLDNADVNPYEYGDTRTGLDQLVQIITDDAGLTRKIANSEIFEGATSANAMNHIIVEAIRETGAADAEDLTGVVDPAANAYITAQEVRDLNAYIRAHYLDDWADLHGDDECGSETGFHLVQNDGATTKLFDLNAVNTVADGIYHLGFEICGGRLLNEDGAKNASLESVADWLETLLADDLGSGWLLPASIPLAPEPLDPVPEADLLGLSGLTDWMMV